MLPQLNGPRRPPARNPSVPLPDECSQASERTQFAQGVYFRQDKRVRIGLRLLKPETVQWPRRTLRAGLRALRWPAGCARKMRGATRAGKLCAVLARKALLRLAEQLGEMSGPVPAGESAGAGGGAQFRGGAAAAGSAEPASGLGRWEPEADARGQPRGHRRLPAASGSARSPGVWYRWIRACNSIRSCCDWSPAGRDLGVRGLPPGNYAVEVDRTTAPGRAWRWSLERSSGVSCSKSLPAGERD